MKILGGLFGLLLRFCYKLTANYGLSIILFTLITKIILLPISVMVQKNSIKMVKMYPEMNHIKAKYFGNKDMASEEEYQLYKREKYHPMLDLIPVILQLIILMGVVDGIHQLNVTNKFFLILDLGVTPVKTGGISILIPILAAISSWLMCFTQNKANVLQSEQSKANQTITLLLSVGLSLYLGFFVPGGVGFYWVISNLMSIILMYLLNYFIDPKKYIDYRALEESKNELARVTQYAAKANKKRSSELISLEKRDYKKFLKYENKQIVFYSEGNGFYKYFQNVIELILKKTDIIIHYITSDAGDEVFKLQNDNFRVYYITENKLIVLMMKMDADIVVMTMPDLQKYHIKRSMMRNDIEYVYMDHGIGSVNLMLRKHALDYFDTIFASNEISYAEIREQEKKYSLKEKTVLKYGFALIDNMIENYNRQPVHHNSPKIILIAPSWQDDNLLDLCIDEILQALTGHGYQIILRPHPQYVRHFKEKLKILENKYAFCTDFSIENSFSSNDTVFNADILITDWSGIAYEYSFTTLKPSLFINTPMKIMNPDYQEIPVVPFDIEIRNQIGISVELSELHTLPDIINQLLSEIKYSNEKLKEMRDKYLYNISGSAEVGARYLINRLIEKSKE
ncbi:membrane protein insertase YidC [bacterium 1xD8-48]|nr:membrane protein insertase YidC [bacterium 1xD8-48]